MGTEGRLRGGGLLEEPPRQNGGRATDPPPPKADRRRKGSIHQSPGRSAHPKESPPPLPLRCRCCPRHRNCEALPSFLLPPLGQRRHKSLQQPQLHSAATHPVLLVDGAERGLPHDVLQGDYTQKFIITARVVYGKDSAKSKVNYPPCLPSIRQPMFLWLPWLS